jgi:tight adherence protein B
MPLWTKTARAEDDRLSRLARGGGQAAAVAEGVVEQRQSADLFPTIGNILELGGRASRMRLALSRAGIPLRPSEFVGFAAVWTAVAAMFGYLLLGHTFIGILVGAVLGVLTPSAVISFAQARRLHNLQLQLPDALMIMASGIRSGFSFMRCLQLVAEEMKPPIGAEFGRTVQEIQIGRSTPEALNRMVVRTNSYDIDLCVTAVNIQMEVGGNLSLVLETIAETIRERFRLKGEIAALTAEGRISGWILFAAPIAMFLFLMKANPEYLHVLLDDRLGIIILYLALGLQIFGGFVIKKMLDIDV